MILDTPKKQVTLYKAQGRVWAVMAVILTVAFVLFVNQFYNTDKNSVVDFNLPSRFNGDFVIEGTTTPSPLKRKGDYVRHIFAIVFDAGSTGSRVHVFKFAMTPGMPIKLVNETFKQVKPGLSSYADDPLQAALSLHDMLATCRNLVPLRQYSNTPLVLKATAGLRLLEHGQADNILNEVTASLKKQPFKLPEEAVGIMDGVDEGVFSWITVNFMLGRLGGSAQPLAALDMGGGSTQITFVPSQKMTLDSVPESYMKNVSLFGKDYHVYTHSYLNLGLMSARFTLTGGDKHKDEDPSHFELTGPCIPEGYSGDYSYGGKVYKLRGANSDEFTYASCASQTAVLVEPVLPVPELSGQEIYIFSYFFDRAQDAGLIGTDGGTIRVGDFRTAAVKAFKSGDLKKPFHALDLTYIYSLLSKGYRISDDTTVHLKKKIAGVEVSWALGAAFEVLTEEGLLR
ncbi:ectonucleoside triphosphate diphosphohydrolase 5-like [Mya arenaria]|uniref:ectonucleoside triphosphate diphosphohydrolase 5-like n=1 Tax=Mya arenaria TaxID=6604 RepID=UPI0022E5CE12|nr:ectonucleoside triphosphate diphosphohydrolase 5-like [Mya arenaria]